jgi:hypothetical protein
MDDLEYNNAKLVLSYIPYTNLLTTGILITDQNTLAEEIGKRTKQIITDFLTKAYQDRDWLSNTTISADDYTEPIDLIYIHKEVAIQVWTDLCNTKTNKFAKIRHLSNVFNDTPTFHNFNKHGLYWNFLFHLWSYLYH